MGRPREFDRQEVLERAMDLFWRRGYRNTSLRDLLEQMGIGRQSLYDTFGDKHSLFVQAVEQYNCSVTQHLVNQLAAEGSPLQNIRSTLVAVASAAGDGQCRGCLMTNTLVELAPHDPEVAAACKAVGSRLEAAFVEALGRAASAGELDTGTSDLQVLARFCLSTMHGLAVMGKAGSTSQDLQTIVDLATSTFSRPPMVAVEA